ncbi:MAG: arylsulfatase [Bacteroidota bacterium]
MHHFYVVIRQFFLFSFFCLCLYSCQEASDKEVTKPNIVIFYVDDLGYGDVGCYGAKKVATPAIDAMAANGILFTDAHSSAATCTPSRYSLLTGNYAFRMKAGILPGDAPLLIRPGTSTLASKLKEVGYSTAVVGKWHLGLGDGNVNWNEHVTPGPAEIGFDYSFLLPSTGDRVPSVYLENQRVIGLTDGDSLAISFTDDASDPNPFGNPTGLSNPELLRQPADTQHSGVIVNGISRIGFMGGAENSWWQDEDFPDLFTQKAETFIEENKEKPFFLYFSFHDIHVPRVVHERFVGKSEMGPRGDAIVQMDWMTGKVLEALEERGLAENTLVIFTSDNGPVLNDGYEDEAVELLGDHQPAGPYRGGKYSIYEGGHRVPTIAYWPSKIAPTKSNALWNQLDLMASLVPLAGYQLNNSEAIDSENILDALLGKNQEGRTEMLEEAFTMAYRKGSWKYIAPTQQKHSWIANTKNIEGGISTAPQLYNLDKDPREQNNVADQHPDIVQQLDSLLNQTINKTLTQ